MSVEETQTADESQTNAHEPLMSRLRELEGSECVRSPDDMEELKDCVMLRFWETDVPREFFQIINEEGYEIYLAHGSDWDADFTLVRKADATTRLDF